MSSHHSCCHGIQCIIPPHMVDVLKIRGDAKQRKMAEAIEKHADNAREQRVEEAPPNGFMAAPVLALEADLTPKRSVYDGQKQSIVAREIGAWRRRRTFGRIPLLMRCMMGLATSTIYMRTSIIVIRSTAAG